MKKEQQEKIPVEIALNSKGKIMISYADPALDDLTRVTLNTEDTSLYGHIPAGMLDETRLFLGKVGSDFVSELSQYSVSEALIVRVESDQPSDPSLTGKMVSFRRV